MKEFWLGLIGLLTFGAVSVGMFLGFLYLVVRVVSAAWGA